MSNLTAQQALSLHSYLEVMLSKNEQHFGEEYAQKLNAELAMIIAQLKQYEKDAFDKELKEKYSIQEGGTNNV